MAMGTVQQRCLLVMAFETAQYFALLCEDHRRQRSLLTRPRFLLGGEGSATLHCISIGVRPNVEVSRNRKQAKLACGCRLDCGLGYGA